MKKMYLVAMILASVFASSAHAFGYEKLKIDDRVVRISGVEADGEHVFSKSEIEGGIYIVAAKNFMVEPTEILSKTTAIIRQRFIDRGFKVVDSPEQASIGIRFSVNEVNCDINAKGVTAIPTTDASAATAGKLAGVAIVGLFAGAVGATSAFNMGGTRSASSLDLELSGNIVINPKDDGMSAAFMKNIKYSDPLRAAYYVKDGSSPEDVLTIMADQWIENYID